MPKCIVPGCTSGYASNPETVHFFTIPKDTNSVQLWKNAVRRTDNIVKPGSAVCQHHFRKSEILWKRELLGPDGQVLGVSHYKIPRLKKGCIPSLFPWTEYSGSDNLEMEKLPSQDNTTVDVPVTNEILSTTEPDPTILDKPESPESVSGSTFQFKDILHANFNLPTGWSRQVNGCEGKQLVFCFIHHTVKKEDIFQTSILKDVTIEENLCVQIRVLGQQLDPIRLNLPSVLKDLQQLENLLMELHRFNVCHGCSDPSIEPGLDQLNFKTARKDASGTWRHSECSFLIPSKTVCEHCSRAKKSLKTSFRRYMQRKSKGRSRMKINETDNKKQIARLQSKCRAALKAKRFAREKIKHLKEEVCNIRQKLSSCISEDLEKHIESGKIPQNQLHVLTQIIDAAKHESAKGRNYSEEWMLLCMRLHMRSPSSYEFLRSNEILPLPSMRTIRRSTCMKSYTN